jgi:hypothetical protein
VDVADLGTPLPAHSELGASGMDRWSHCPGSFGLSRCERHKAPTIHAATGTVAHTLIEQAFSIWNAGGRPGDGLAGSEGVTVEVDGYDITVDADMTAGVRMMLDYMDFRRRELKVSPLVEQTVFLDSYFPVSEPPPVRMFGRCDVQFRAGDFVEIVDYKNGSGVLVNVTDNMQLMYYGAGVLAELTAQGLWPARIRLTVVQPNARTPEKIRSQDLTTLDVVIWVDEVLVPAVRACEDPNARFVTGSWCRFCPVAHACPALLGAAREAARTQFDDSAESDTLAERLALAERVILWAEAMKGFGLLRIKEGLRVPGWAEVPTRPTRKWTDTAAIESLLAGFDIWDKKLRSPAQVEKLLKKSSPDTWGLVSPYVESKSSGTKLARVGPNEDTGFDELMEPV